MSGFPYLGHLGFGGQLRGVPLFVQRVLHVAVSVRANHF